MPRPRLALLLACTLLPLWSMPAQAVSDVWIPIGALQGSGETSPKAGQEVTVVGVVTSNFSEGLGGFFLQNEGDGDPRTSEGLFVMAAEGSVLPEVQAGDRVRVSGLVAEEKADNRNSSLTTLRANHVAKTGRGEIAPLRLSGPPQDWEALEGMLVRIDAPLTLNSTDTRFGETIASFDGRLWTPTELATPGSPQIKQVEADNARTPQDMAQATDDWNHGERFGVMPGTGLPRLVAPEVAGLHLRHSQSASD